MLYIGNTKYRVYSGENRVSIKSPLGNDIEFYDYLQSDGIAYIVTDYIPNDTSGILVTANCATTSGNNQVVGVRQASTGDNRWWVNFSSTLEIAWNTWKTTNISKNEYQNNWITVENNYLNSRLGKVNGVTKRTEYPTLVNITYPAYIFVGNSGGSPFENGNFIGKIKNVKFTEGNNIVRDFVPCKYNGLCGMWDKINNKFYGNVNSSGTFTVGNEIKYYDYLQTTNGAYIDTGFKPNQDSRVLADILLLNRNLTAIFGTRNNSAWPYGAFVLWNGPSLYYLYGDVVYSTYKLSDAIVNEHITIDLNKNVGTVNNSPVTCNTATFQTNYPFLIGNIHTASYIDPRPTPMKVYSFKMYDNDVLIRDFKPCLYNGEAGLWDSVECKFYGNANNTGTLTVGNDS